MDISALISHNSSGGSSSAEDSTPTIDDKVTERSAHRSQSPAVDRHQQQQQQQQQEEEQQQEQLQQRRDSGADHDAFIPEGQSERERDDEGASLLLQLAAREVVNMTLPRYQSAEPSCSPTLTVPEPYASYPSSVSPTVASLMNSDDHDEDSRPRDRAEAVPRPMIDTSPGTERVQLHSPTAIQHLLSPTLSSPAAVDSATPMVSPSTSKPMTTTEHASFTTAATPAEVPVDRSPVANVSPKLERRASVAVSVTDIVSPAKEGEVEESTATQTTPIDAATEGSRDISTAVVESAQTTQAQVAETAQTEQVSVPSTTHSVDAVSSRLPQADDIAPQQQPTATTTQDDDDVREASGQIEEDDMMQELDAELDASPLDATPTLDYSANADIPLSTAVMADGAVKMQVDAKSPPLIPSVIAEVGYQATIDMQPLNPPALPQSTATDTQTIIEPTEHPVKIDTDQTGPGAVSSSISSLETKQHIEEATHSLSVATTTTTITEASHGEPMDAVSVKTELTDDLSTTGQLKLEAEGNETASPVDTPPTTSTEVAPQRRLRLRRCYCNRERQSTKRPPITCSECGIRFHIDCIMSASRYRKAVLPGDDFFHFICYDCNKGSEIFQRLSLSWVDVVHLTLFTFAHTSPWKERDPQEDGRVYYTFMQDICAFIQSRWEQFWLREQAAGWEDQVAAALQTGLAECRFESGQQNLGRAGMWTLASTTRFPSSYPAIEARVPAYNLLVSGKLTSLHAEAMDVAAIDSGKARKREEQSGDGVSEPGINGSKRVKSDHTSAANGNRGYLIRPGQPTIELYPDLENPGGPIRLSRQPTHTAVRVQVADDGMSATNEKASIYWHCTVQGYRMSKATHSVCEGAWYYEARISGDPGSNARIGWSQISGDLQGPCGMDEFSYAYRASPGTVFHNSIGKPFGDGYGNGDVLGVLINIPPLNSAERDDLDRRRWRLGTNYTAFRYACPDELQSATDSDAEDAKPQSANYRTPVLPRVRNSELRFYKNGQFVGVAFREIRLGRYYPAVSCYMKCHVHVNFGPDFAYPLPELPDGIRARPLADLEQEMSQEQRPDIAPSLSEAEHIRDGHGIALKTAASADTLPASTAAQDSVDDPLSPMDITAEQHESTSLLQMAVAIETSEEPVFGNGTPEWEKVAASAGQLQSSSIGSE